MTFKSLHVQSLEKVNSSHYQVLDYVWVAVWWWPSMPHLSGLFIFLSREGFREKTDSLSLFLKESVLKQKQDIKSKKKWGVFTTWLKVPCGETKETTVERLRVDQRIESETMLYFKNNETWQVMGAHHDLIALSIN